MCRPIQFINYIGDIIICVFCVRFLSSLGLTIVLMEFTILGRVSRTITFNYGVYSVIIFEKYTKLVLKYSVWVFTGTLGNVDTLTCVFPPLERSTFYLMWIFLELVPAPL